MNKQLNGLPFFLDFLKRLHPLELVKLQHELRQYPEDRQYLEQVLEELKQRDKKNE
jgi:hypothetical protein